MVAVPSQWRLRYLAACSHPISLRSRIALSRESGIAHLTACVLVLCVSDPHLVDGPRDSVRATGTDAAVLLPSKTSVRVMRRWIDASAALQQECVSRVSVGESW